MNVSKSTMTFQSYKLIAIFFKIDDDGNQIFQDLKLAESLHQNLKNVKIFNKL